MVTIEQQIACVEREIGMRRFVYPKWVAKGSMTQEKAEHELAAMMAVKDTLEEYKVLSAQADGFDRIPD